MKLNQLVRGLIHGKNSYRLQSWPEGKFIKEGEGDRIYLFDNDNVVDKEWHPTYDEAFINNWVPVDAITAPHATPENDLPVLLRKLEKLPIGTKLELHSQIPNAADIVFFDGQTDKLTVQYRDEHGVVIPGELTTNLLTLAGWVQDNEPAAELSPPTTSDDDGMKIANQEEILKLCQPLQDRLRANSNFVRIEIPIADAGFVHGGQDASLLISINPTDVEFHAHVDGRELSNFPTEAGFTINRRLIEGPLAQREAKPLSAIAVPSFMVRGSEWNLGKETNTLIDPGTPTIEDGLTLNLSFDPTFKVRGHLDIQFESGTYRTLPGGERYFELMECRGGMVIGRFHDDSMHLQSAMSGDLFELFFQRLPKVTKGVRLQNVAVGTQVVVSEVGDDAAIVDIDLGFSTTVGEIPIEQLQSDDWVFLSFDSDYGQPKEAPPHVTAPEKPGNDSNGNGNGGKQHGSRTGKMGVRVAAAAARTGAVPTNPETPVVDTDKPVAENAETAHQE